jgi:ankyrin repeat protein
VRVLADKGANLDLAAEDGATPVFVAAQDGHHEVVRLLADNGANLDLANKNGTTPVLIAAKNGHHEVVRVLAENGANLDLAAKNGATPVLMAAQCGHLEVVRILNQYKARLHDPADNGNTSLHLAAICGHLDVVRYLARHGADIARLDLRGESPLDKARNNGHTSVASLLEAVESAGSWRKYIALRRMAYILIRHEVSATYKVLPKKKKKLRKLRALLHFVFGRNREAVGAAALSHGERQAAVEGGSEEPKAMQEMQVLPDDVFALLCRFIV